MSNGSGDRRLSEFLDRMIANGDTVYAGIGDWYGTPIVEGEGHYYQWDKNQKLLVLIPDSWTPQLSYGMYSPTGSFTEVQAAEAAFGYPNQEVYRRDPAPKALGRLITAMNKHWLEFEVPNKALEKSGEMWAYITVTSEHHTMTEFIVKIMVLPRVKPEPYQSLNDPDSVAKVLAMLIEARDRAEAAATRSEAAKAAAAASASAAAQSETNASHSASLASGYANNAKGYRDQAKSYYDSLVNAGTTVTQLSTKVTTLEGKVSTLENCCNEVSDYIPPPFTLAINGSAYGYKDTGGSFHPFKHPSGTLTLTANTGSSGVNTEYGSDGAYYEKVVVDVPEGPGPTTHTTTYTPVAENDSGSGNDMGESHSHRYVNTSGLYKVNQGTKTIRANTGSAGEDVTHYSKVVVDVPASGYSLSGTKEVTANGEYNVAKDSSTAYEKFKVNVAGEKDELNFPLCKTAFSLVQQSSGSNAYYQLEYMRPNNTSGSNYTLTRHTGGTYEAGTLTDAARFHGLNTANGNFEATAPQDAYYLPFSFAFILSKYCPSAFLVTSAFIANATNGNSWFGTSAKRFYDLMADFQDTTDISSWSTNSDVYFMVISRNGYIGFIRNTISPVYSKAGVIKGNNNIYSIRDYGGAIPGTTCIHTIFVNRSEVTAALQSSDIYSGSITVGSKLYAHLTATH